MRKTINLCDLCNKEITNIKKLNIGLMCYEMCEECYNKTKTMKEEIKTLNDNYNKEYNMIFKKYGLKNIE